MTHPLTAKTVYVEGDDDESILRAWFPNMSFTNAGGKDKVADRIQRHPACHGLRDRDFAEDAAVADFFRYFGPLPPLQPLSRAQVVQELQRRLASLIRPEEVENVLEARFHQIQQDITAWDGLHRWINGKVLLENCLYPRVFEPFGLSQARLRDALIEAGKAHAPTELQELAVRWSS